jgi:hypothetical protein
VAARVVDVCVVVELAAGVVELAADVVEVVGTGEAACVVLDATLATAVVDLLVDPPHPARPRAATATGSARRVGFTVGSFVLVVDRTSRTS